MSLVQETIKGVETQVRKLSRIPGLGRLLGSEVPRVDQESLNSQVRKTVLVGDFGFQYDVETMSATAQRAVEVLTKQGIVNSGSKVKIRTMIPSVGVESDVCLDRSADILSNAFSRTGTLRRHVDDPDPITVPVSNMDHLPHQAYARLGEAVAQDAHDPEEINIILGNPVFFANAFPGLTAHDMHAGGIAVLAEVGENPEGNRFDSLWPAEPRDYMHQAK